MALLLKQVTRRKCILRPNAIELGGCINPASGQKLFHKRKNLVDKYCLNRVRQSQQVDISHALLPDKSVLLTSLRPS